MARGKQALREKGHESAKDRGIKTDFARGYRSERKGKLALLDQNREKKEGSLNNKQRGEGDLGRGVIEAAREGEERSSNQREKHHHV